MTFDPLLYPLLAALAMAVACAVLSVLIVPQRWTFIGEGIGHSGMGGAGTAWIIGLIFPTINLERLAPLMIVAFCLATAVGIGFFTRRQRVNSDAAIGIFLVASLAWGLLANNIYFHFRSSSPVGYNALLWGNSASITPRFARASVATAGLVLFTLFAFKKEILSYCLDETMAEVSGVPTRLIHYLLMILMAVTVLIGMPIVGSILVTAMLILPGTTASLLSDRLRGCTIWSMSIATVATLAGVLLNAWKSFLPVGPSIVLMLFVIFVCVYVFGRARA